VSAAGLSVERPKAQVSFCAGGSGCFVVMQLIVGVGQSICNKHREATAPLFNFIRAAQGYSTFLSE
jgi:hypothetical protein